MQPFHILEGSRSILLSLFEVCGMAGAPRYHTLKGAGSLLFSLFEVCKKRSTPHRAEFDFQSKRLRYFDLEPSKP